MCFCFSHHCCVKVSLNLLVNLLGRIRDDIMELIQCHGPPRSTTCEDVVTSEDQYQRFEQVQPCGNDPQRSPPPDPDHRVQLEMSPPHLLEGAIINLDKQEGVEPSKGSSSSVTEGRLYSVIYDTVELEPYFYNVDREQCERMLAECRDGVCIVRPFKFKHARIRYILSVRAIGSYFHLFIRRAGPNGLQYALGLQKQRERHFRFPADIVQHYRTHLLECANETVKIRLHLVPLLQQPLPAAAAAAS